MLEIFALTRFERLKSISLYLHAKGIAATVRPLVSLESVLLFKLEKIIPTALAAILYPSSNCFGLYYGALCHNCYLGLISALLVLAIIIERVGFMEMISGGWNWKKSVFWGVFGTVIGASIGAQIGGAPGAVAGAVIGGGAGVLSGDE